ncbi:hypothetical protein PDIDSM_6962 [Penicillium digitatum]|nr:hypothetical protein PDIDSM_6962 [Penicillium digitatum]
MIYLYHGGKLEVDKSSSIQEQNSTVFTPEVCQNFLEILDERIGYHAPRQRTHSRFDTLTTVDVAGDTKQSLKHTSHVEIIYEILQVQEMEERFERGEVDANMVVDTMNRSPSPKGEEEDDSATSVAIEEPEHI